MPQISKQTSIYNKKRKVMNNARRKEIREAISLIQEAVDILVNVREDEEMAYENLPEGIQMSERGDAMQEWIDTLTDAEDSIQDVIDNLENQL